METKWKWTAQRERAALFVAADEITDEEIARNVGVTKRTLERWKQVPEFRERVNELVEAFRARVREHGIAQLERRVARQNETWNSQQRIIKARRFAAEVQRRRHNEAVIAAQLDNPDEENLDRPRSTGDPGELHPGQDEGLFIREITYSKGGITV